MNQSIGVMKHSLHKQIRDLYLKKESLNTQIDKLEIQSQINALYDKLENLSIIDDNWEIRLIVILRLRVPGKPPSLLNVKDRNKGLYNLLLSDRGKLNMRLFKSQDNIVSKSVLYPLKSSGFRDVLLSFFFYPLDKWGQIIYDVVST